LAALLASLKANIDAPDSRIVLRRNPENGGDLIAVVHDGKRQAGIDAFSVQQQAPQAP
jgi:hypothetical protein